MSFCEWFNYVLILFLLFGFFYATKLKKKVLKVPEISYIHENNKLQFYEALIIIKKINNSKLEAEEKIEINMVYIDLVSFLPFLYKLLLIFQGQITCTLVIYFLLLGDLYS